MPLYKVTIMDKTEIDSLIIKARDALSREDSMKAIDILLRLSEEDIEDPSIANNLATAYYMQGKYEQALKYLEKNLSDSAMNPFARALASQIYNKIGMQVKARDYLKDGIRQFEWGVRATDRLMVSITAWKEYTVALKRAAGLLGDHRLVIELHKRWEKHYQTGEDYYQAGIAFFNLGYYDRAFKVWRRLLKKGWKFIKVYNDALELFNRRIIPGFELEYEVPDIKTLPKSKEDFAWNKGVNRLFMLGISLFDNEFDKQEFIIQTLIKESGDWGRETGLAILKSNWITKDIKMSAAIALMDIGVFEKDEPIPVVIDGKETMVVVQKGDPFEDLSPKEKRELERAREYAKQEQYEKALDIIDTLQKEKPVQIDILNLAGKLHAVMGDTDIAKNIADQFYSMGKHEIFCLLVAAEIHTIIGEVKTALDIIDELDEDEVPDELVPKLHLIERNIRNTIKSNKYEVIKELNKSYIIEELERPLPKQRKLMTCLRHIPVQWLNGICLRYDLKLEGQRQERAKILFEHILEPRKFQSMLKSLSSNARELLTNLFTNGGEAFLEDLDAKYGNFEEENYWWIEEDFVTAIGEICHYGFAFVGSLTKGSREEPGIIIPKEIQGLL